MKRALLIATGTVGGLGAVLAITPPQLGGGNALLSGASASTSGAAQNGAQGSNASATNSGTANSSANSSASASAGASSSSTSKSVTKKSTSSANSKNSNSGNASSNTPAPSASASSNSSSTSVSGAFSGDAIDVGYGIVQVKITVSNGKITDAVALQAPNGRSQRFTDYSVPNLRSQTLQVQSAAISGVSGASYTSYGWYKSLISALQKAGMPTGV